MRPCDILDLEYWTLMRDTGPAEHPDNGYPGCSSWPDKFYARLDHAVAFTARVDGTTSKGSEFPRVELHQMKDKHGNRAEWNSRDRHCLTATLSLDTRKLVKRKRLVGTQIHSGGDDVCQVMLHETRGLILMFADGKRFLPIDGDYKDGTKFALRLCSESDTITVYYNWRKVGTIKAHGTTWSWKIGCYLQSNVKDYHEPPGASGTVVVWSCVLTGGSR
jgi:hypothetical protein